MTRWLLHHYLVPLIRHLSRPIDATERLLYPGRFR